MQSLVPKPGTDRAAEQLAAAESAVRTYCGWHIAPVVVQTLTLDGSGGNSQFIPTLRIEDLTSLTNDGVALDPNTIEWSADGFIRLPRGQRWTGRLRGVTVTLSHGHREAADVVEIIRAMATRAEMSPGGFVQEQALSTGLTPSMTAPGVAGGVVLMAHERKMLAPYKLNGAP